MAEKVKIHPVTPHKKRIFEVADQLKMGSIAMFPTDSQYSLGCVYTNKKGIERIRQIRNLDKNHLLTLICDSLSGISKFALITDDNFKIIKRLMPGPYTFVLPATKAVPKLLLNPRRKTIGFRVPDYPICQELIAEIGDPLISTTAKFPNIDGELNRYPDREELFHSYEKLIDIIIDDQQDLSKQESTVIDLTEGPAIILRRGLGAAKVEEVCHQYDKELVEA
ncbi:MAG TPA: L-threonylcarbamoyladenylate synthase [Balneolales bacterium]|nr:L-threonylcarbamoyladenylate synthase [Balneolales bacterium]